MNYFLTGCDKNHEWMNEWFLYNYRLYNKTPIIFADFGVSPKMRAWCESNFDKVIDVKSAKGGWFSKPQSMVEASKIANKVCWMDNDCEVLGDMSSIFDLTEPNKLGLTHCKVWIKRRSEEWFSTGIVVFEGQPQILNAWVKNCAVSNERGDMEVMHSMLRDPLARLTYVNLIPNKYQYTRIQVMVDNDDDPFKLMMHWSGPVGKDIIREKMKNGKTR